MIQNLKYIIALKPKEILKSVLWEIVHSGFITAPSGILLIIVWELFKEQPNISLVWVMVGLMCLLLCLQFFVASRTLVSANHSVYELGKENSIRLVNQ